MICIYLNKKSYFIFIFAFLRLTSQSYSLDELDSISMKYRHVGKVQQAIDLNKKALLSYRHQNNFQGIVAANINIANFLSITNQHKESLKFLDAAEKNLKTINNNDLKSKFYMSYGRSLYELTFCEEALKNFNLAMTYAWKITDKKKREKYIYSSYSWKLSCFTVLKIEDSVKSIEKKILAIAPEPLIYTSIAYRLMEEKKLDSSKYFLDKAMNMVDHYPVYDKSVVLLNYGDLYNRKKEYEKALIYSHQALTIAEETGNKINKREAYKLIFSIYNSLNDSINSNKFLKKYTLINDSMNNVQKEVIHYPISKITAEKEQHEEREKLNLYIVLLVIISIFITILYFVKKKYNLRKKGEQDLITKASELTKKLNPAFAEVIKLAKQGDPFFLTRFKEVYPDFYNNLIAIYPNLTVNEIRFCALLRLNLSNKDIVRYENLSLRTVETKRYRLRSKLGFSSNADFTKWIMEL